MAPSEAGFSLIETSVAMAVSAMSALAIVNGIERLGDHAALVAGRRQAVHALLAARRRAYFSGRPVDVRTEPGARHMTIETPGRAPERRRLPRGVRITTGPADGRVTFRSSGFADNATVGLESGTSDTAIIVNQRGLVR